MDRDFCHSGADKDFDLPPTLPHSSYQNAQKTSTNRYRHSCRLTLNIDPSMDSTMSSGQCSLGLYRTRELFHKGAARANNYSPKWYVP